MGVGKEWVLGEQRALRNAGERAERIDSEHPGGPQRRSAVSPRTRSRGYSKAVLSLRAPLSQARSPCSSAFCWVFAGPHPPPDPGKLPVREIDLYNGSHYIFGNVLKCSLFLQRKLEKIMR